MSSAGSGRHPGRFVDLEQAARALAALLPQRLRDPGVTVVALGEPARPIATVVAEHLGRPLQLLPTPRAHTDSGSGGQTAADSRADPENSDRLSSRFGGALGDEGCAVVVDRGVETGRSALLAASALREAGYTELVLAVPVCPRQTEVTLVREYTEIVAVHRPLARRSLQWHYATPLE